MGFVLEILIAVFGGIYLILRIMSEKAGSSISKNSREIRRSKLETECNKWMDMVVDKELEKKCEKAAWIIRVYGDRWDEKVSDEDIDNSVKEHCSLIPEEIVKSKDKRLINAALMATYGKLPSGVACCGIHTDEFPNYSDDRRERFWMLQRRCILIDNILKENGMSVPFIFRPIRIEHSSWDLAASTADNIDIPKEGTYFWWPARIMHPLVYEDENNLERLFIEKGIPYKID